jgi:hypothetical protein
MKTIIQRRIPDIERIVSQKTQKLKFAIQRTLVSRIRKIGHQREEI